MLRLLHYLHYYAIILELNSSLKGWRSIKYTCTKQNVGAGRGENVKTYSDVLHVKQNATRP